MHKSVIEKDRKMQVKNRENDRAEINRLLSNAQKGDDEAFSKLLQIYEPLLLSMVSKYSLEYDAQADREDIHQELCVVFCNAARAYDVAQSEVDFGFYAKVCLKNALISRYRGKKSHSVEILSIDDVSGLHSPDEPASYLIEVESAAEVRRLIDETLSDYEKKVWGMYLEGKTPRQIAKELGRDAKSTSNALSRIRAKLRAAVGEQHT